MRIVFLGSSLAAGRDGVGDYIRSLSAELTRQGHHCLAIGLADTEDALDECNPIVRIDRHRPWAQRLLQARVAIAGFAPDWVSLQFVPYAWHPRGYALGLGKRLAPLFGRRRRHLMFHELWVGLNRHDRFVNRMHGIVQRHVVRHLHYTLRPDLTHTQTPAYVSTLAADHIAAQRLPLFGNIPVAPGDRAAIRRELIAAHAPALDPSRTLVAGWFGTVHREWNGVEAVARLAAAARAEDRPLLLLSLGRTGAGGAALARHLSAAAPAGASFVDLGETPPEHASRTLAAFDLALTPNPVALVPKSGTVAACLDHGVPVLVTRDDWQLRGEAAIPPLDEPLVVSAGPEHPIDLPALLALRRAPAPRLPAIARQFAADLAAVAGV